MIKIDSRGYISIINVKSDVNKTYKLASRVVRTIKNGAFVSYISCCEAVVEFDINHISVDDILFALVERYIDVDILIVSHVNPHTNVYTNVQNSLVEFIAHKNAHKLYKIMHEMQGQLSCKLKHLQLIKDYKFNTLHLLYDVNHSVALELCQDLLFVIENLD